MGQRTWITHGYGICTNEIKTTVDRLEDLLKTAPKFAKKVHEYQAALKADFYQRTSAKNVKFEVTVEHYETYDQTTYNGIASILQEVILEAEGIWLTVADSDDSKIYLLFEAGYPWKTNEKAKNLTEEDVKNLFKKYVSILTDEPIEIDYQAVENGG